VAGFANRRPSGVISYALLLRSGAVFVTSCMPIVVSFESAPGGTSIRKSPSTELRLPPSGPMVALTRSPMGSPCTVRGGPWLGMTSVPPSSGSAPLEEATSLSTQPVETTPRVASNRGNKFRYL
jgi:hypothetical protein